jgi:hypothetical protein
VHFATHSEPLTRVAGRHAVLRQIVGSLALALSVLAFGSEPASASGVRFGTYPGGGATGSAAAEGASAARLSALQTLRGGKPFVLDLYTQYTTEGQRLERGVLRDIRRYTQAGLLVEVVLRYRSEHLAGYAGYVRRAVGMLSRTPGVVSVQVGNEFDVKAARARADGAYPHALAALAAGLIAAHSAARGKLSVGVNCAYHPGGKLPHALFAALGADDPRVRRAIDWFGLDIYPATREALPASAAPGIAVATQTGAALAALRRQLTASSGLGKRVAIHISQNGYPSSSPSTPELQTSTLSASVLTVTRLAGSLHISDYRYFELRDSDGHAGSGLVSGSYVPKPAFAAYQQLIQARTAGAPDLTGNSTVPPQGVFDWCSLDTDSILAECIARLHTIAGAGFKVVVEPLASYRPWLGAYLQAIKDNGLQVMWEMTDTGWWGYNGSNPFGYSDNGTVMPATDGYGAWADACGCQTNAQLLSFIVQTLTASGVTYGWYVADDAQFLGPLSFTPAEALVGIKRFAADLHALAPQTTTLMSTWGMSDTKQLSRAYGAADLTAQEAYPIATYSGDAVGAAQATHDVVAAAQATQGVADARHGHSALILQAFSWGECANDAQESGADPSSAFPSAAELLAMRNAALEYSHPSLLLWYRLEGTIGFATGETPSDCRAPSNPQARLAALSAAVTARYPSARN